jgi:hypothetical protein
MTGGWQAHLARVERWYHRAALAKDEYDQLDFLFVFFESSFSLRDWLIDNLLCSDSGSASCRFC